MECSSYFVNCYSHHFTAKSIHSRKQINYTRKFNISSTTKGTLITRMTTAQRKAIASPAIGLLVYDLDKKTIYMYEGTKWQPFLYTTTENKLPPTPVDATGGLADDWFGYSVSVSGDYAIVGAPNYDEGALNQGAAYKCRRCTNVHNHPVLF